MSNEKLALHQHCRELVQQRIDTLRESLQQIADAKSKETKSSAGDKFETGRSMLQRQEEQHGAQLLNAMEQLQQLEDAGRNMAGETVGPGCLVTTKKNRRYYLSIGLGKVNYDGQMYFCISAAAPIGEKLMGLKSGEKFSFNEQADQIIAIN